MVAAGGGEEGGQACAWPHLRAAVPAPLRPSVLAPRALSLLGFRAHPVDLVAAFLSHFTEGDTELQRERELRYLANKDPSFHHCSAQAAATRSPSPQWTGREADTPAGADRKVGSSGRPAGGAQETRGPPSLAHTHTPSGPPGLPTLTTW